jgi:aspartate dehydrogenase
MKRIGILGYGKLGQYLVAQIQEGALGTDVELAFVWNRTSDKIDDKIPVISKARRIDDALEMASRRADLVVEVAHPEITSLYGRSFLERSAYLVGSPTVFADDKMKKDLFGLAQSGDHSLVLPYGALEGIEGIIRMRDVLGVSLEGGKIVMRKDYDSVKWSGKSPDHSATSGEAVFYRGPLRELCQLAPQNVNTMALFALVTGLGFDTVQAELIGVPDFGKHQIDWEVWGPEVASGQRYRITSGRHNPAAPGAVTGSVTYKSFLHSVLRATDIGVVSYVARGQTEPRTNGVHYL